MLLFADDGNAAPEVPALVAALKVHAKKLATQIQILCNSTGRQSSNAVCNYQNETAALLSC